jgi:hypothetical protein
MTAPALLAKANIAKLMPAYKSNAEADFARLGPAIMQEHLGQPVALTQYEPLSFCLPGGRYTPDFLIIAQDGSLALVEVKASKREKGYRDARSKLRAAAALCRWARFYEVIIDRTGWNVEEIEPGDWIG